MDQIEPTINWRFIMSRIKEKDIQYVYDVLLESPEIQNLIRKIANGNMPIHPASVKNDDCIEEANLRSRLSNVPLQLKETTEELEKYKNFYQQTRPKLERYDSLKTEVGNLRNEKDILSVELQSTKEELEKYKNFYRQAQPKLERYRSLEDEVADLHRREQNYVSRLEENGSEIEHLESTVDNLRKEKDSLSAELQSTNEMMQGLKKQFETPMKYLELYRSLSSSVRSGLENVIMDCNEITFIASCSNESSLSSIWEYIKEISEDSDSRDFKTLNLIFDYFFEVFNASSPEPKYERDDVEIGDELDDEYYDRCCGSSTSGDITEIILKGYRSRNTGKIIHKSLVKAL